MCRNSIIFTFLAQSCIVSCIFEMFDKFMWMTFVWLVKKDVSLKGRAIGKFLCARLKTLLQNSALVSLTCCNNRTCDSLSDGVSNAVGKLVRLFIRPNLKFIYLHTLLYTLYIFIIPIIIRLLGTWHTWLKFVMTSASRKCFSKTNFGSGCRVRSTTLLSRLQKSKMPTNGDGSSLVSCTLLVALQRFTRTWSFAATTHGVEGCDGSIVEVMFTRRFVFEI